MYLNSNRYTKRNRLPCNRLHYVRLRGIHERVTRKRRTRGRWYDTPSGPVGRPFSLVCFFYVALSLFGVPPRESLVCTLDIEGWVGSVVSGQFTSLLCYVLDVMSRYVFLAGRPRTDVKTGSLRGRLFYQEQNPVTQKIFIY